MKKVFDEITWYCFGNKGHLHKVKHGNLKEYKNITKVQDWLSILPEGDEFYEKRWKELLKANTNKN